MTRQAPSQTPAPPDDWLDDLDVDALPHAPLAPLNWYRLGGAARWLVRPQGLAGLTALSKRCRDLGVELRVLGGGANLLVADQGVPGVVVKLDAPQLASIRVEGETIIAGGGADLARLTLAAARAGLAGLERMAGIPGSVGGAIRMNAGGAYGEIGPLVEWIERIDPDGVLRRVPGRDLDFDYRCSGVDGLVTAACFRLAPDDPVAVRSRVKEIFAFKKRSQPMAERSAGCAFKNPIVPADRLPAGVMPAANGRVSAGLLIDRAGLKGETVGAAAVSNRHANFIVTRPGATATDVFQLLQRIEHRVAERLGVTLAREVVTWP